MVNYLDPSPYPGYSFENAVESFTDSEKRILKKRCIDFTVKLINELQQRLPENVKILKDMNVMSVTQVLKSTKGIVEVIKLAEHFGQNPKTIDKIVSQWKSINNNKWENVTDTLKFWVEVSEYKYANNENPYNELVSLAFTLLSLPHSNALC